MKSQNAKENAPDEPDPENEERELRALLSVDLDDDDGPPFQPVDAFSEAFMMQLQMPRPPRFDG